MGIKIRGLQLGKFGIDYEILVNMHPDYMLHTERKSGEKFYYQCPSLSYIIDHPDGRILFETGISENWKEEWLAGWLMVDDLSEITTEVCLESRLKSLGLGPDDFEYVIQGHLHTDHAGGLRLFEDAGARVIVHEDEYRFVTTNIHEPDLFFNRKDWGFLGRKQPWTVYGDQEILKDVHVISLPGHTPGTMGVLLRLDHTGWVLLTSDAIYTHDSYGPPAVGSPIVWNGEAWANSVAKLRALAVERNAYVFPGHDEVGIQHHPGGQELKPIDFTPGYVYQ